MTPESNRLAAIILAAGQGTRMKSTRAKVLFEVAGEPMIAWPVRRALGMGADPVVVVVGHQAETVEAAVEARFPGRTRAALQAERLGTGHAARTGLDTLPDFQGVVLILYGDVPLLEEKSLRSLIACVGSNRPVAVMTTELPDPTGYGRILRDEAGNVTRIVEHKDATEAERKVSEVNAGIYAVESNFLRSALSRLKSDNAQGEYYVTDIVDLARGDGLEVAGELVDAEEVQGANDRRQLAQLERLARRRAVERHLAAGVSFLDPETTWVGPEVEIGVDAVIHAGVHLRGKTSVGAGCIVDVGSVLTDARLEPEAVVHPYSVIEGASMGPRSQLGPFGRLRPAARLEAGARVGNFVEVKKATLGEGAKANHLAYIGDAEVGPGANLGAGTITCNYDGVGKYRTEVGEGVFVGSNSTLVAPLSIGKGAYVAAGSVLTDPVPEDALALGRARQVVKSDRAPSVRAAAVKRKAQKPE
ncbi:MAG: bifunctional UDP-N-acetylglucosamine diphosphorylase/glucosamine-1-phosphate N-acetyltransferase GlmU [Myxococcota bacterium]